MLPMNYEVNLHDAKTHLSRYLAQLTEGERIVICKRNRPIAEIRLLPKEQRQPRPIGLGKGSAEIPSEFFEPLPDELTEMFGGMGP